MKLNFRQSVSFLGVAAMGSILLLVARSSGQEKDGLAGRWVGKVNGEVVYLEIRGDSTCSINSQNNCRVTYPLVGDPEHNISFDYEEETQNLEMRGNFNGETIDGDRFSFSQETDCPLPSKWNRSHRFTRGPLLKSSIGEPRRQTVLRGNPSA
jgi:hypothetical protein